MSSGRNLIAGRQILETHVYVCDLVAGTTEIVSERPDGQTANGPTAQPSLSGDGRSCKGTDASGNVATGSFSVHVQGVDKQFAELKSMVDTFDMSSKVRRDQLAAVRSALDTGRTGTACSVLKGFVNEMRDESGKGLTVDLAAVLAERASRIRGVLACD